MRPEWITSGERFDEIASAWDQLAAAEGSPFSRHAWLSAWWRAFTDSSSLRIGVIWSGDRLAAGLPLYRSGRMLRTLANYHTPALPMLFEDGDALTELTELVATERAAQVVFEPLPDDDRTNTFVNELRSAPGQLVRAGPLRTSPIVETGGDFDAWRTASKSRWGAPIERFRRKADREHGLRVRLVEPAGDLAAELKAGLELEAQGWKGERGTAILSSPDTEQFYNDVAERFQQTDELRLSEMRFGDRLVAFDICLLVGGRLYLLKTAYDESMRKLAPGLVLRLSTIERCFELGIEAFELLGGADEWKLKFSTTARESLEIRAFRTSPAGLGAYAYARALRPILKRGAHRMRATLGRMRG